MKVCLLCVFVSPRPQEENQQAEISKRRATTTAIIIIIIIFLAPLARHRPGWLAGWLAKLISSLLKRRRNRSNADAGQILRDFSAVGRVSWRQRCRASECVFIQSASFTSSLAERAYASKRTKQHTQLAKSPPSPCGTPSAHSHTLVALRLASLSPSLSLSLSFSLLRPTNTLTRRQTRQYQNTSSKLEQTQMLAPAAYIRLLYSSGSVIFFGYLAV